MNKIFHNLTRSSKAGSVTEIADAPNEKKIRKSAFKGAVIVLASELKGLFNPNPHNRGGNINWSKVHYISRSIAENHTEYLADPIQVDIVENMISEGHHTYYGLIEAYEKYGVDCEVLILYHERPKGVSIDKYTMEKNNCKKQWDTIDYVNMYIMNGNRNYKNLIDMGFELDGLFVKKTEDGKKSIKCRYTSALCGKNPTDELKDGTYKLTESQKEAQLKLGRMINAIVNKACVEPSGAWLENFIIAFANLMNGMSDKAINKKFEYIMNNLDKIVFDKSTSTAVWKDRLVNL